MKTLPSLLATKLAVENYGSDQEYINAAKEMVQEIALLGLSRTNFFSRAAFHGGTAFRICYGLSRFSEDLDFALIDPDPKFSLNDSITALTDEFTHWGLSLEVSRRENVQKTVQKLFIKETSLGAILSLNVKLHREYKFKVKLEVDTNPPPGAQLRSALCHYPTDFYVVCHSLDSMFAGKLAALLAREYPKGRDWYDLIEYLRRKVKPNLQFLRACLLQSQPAYCLPIPDELTPEWIVVHLLKRLETIDIAVLQQDVRPFLSDPRECALWSHKFFKEKLAGF